jgi:uncharacterized coiled-coil protein SlyX
MTESEEIRRLAERVVVLEEWMMHTDRLLANLNDVVCTLQNRLDEQTRKFDAQQAVFARLAVPDEQRSFEDERPPHY